MEKAAKKVFQEENKKVQGQGRRSGLKSRVIQIINTVYERVLPSIEAKVLLLQYGSAFFEADDTEESDFDILMVAKYSDMEKFMG